MTRQLYKGRTNIAKISQQVNQPKIYHAYLAEDYDGIGQFVLVHFGLGSSNVGIRAKVAAGDFGTGQIIPIDTPVTVFVYRGGVEVLSLGAK